MQTLEHFHREAVKHNLSAGAILLWHQLYFTMERKNQFADLQQSTAVLMAQLQVTRQGLAVMRQVLTERGFLNVRVDEHQQTFYTLMIEGKTVGGGRPFPQIIDMAQSITGTESAQKTRQTAPAANDLRVLTVGAGALDSPSGDAPFVSHSFMAMQRDVQWPSPTIIPANNTTAHPSGDLILTNRIRPYIDAFCDKFGPAMKGDLLQWAEMRRKNGWTLTLWGLEELFKKLIALSDGIGANMAQIVAQSINRRWKGFFALKVKAKPGGEALRKQEKSYQPRPKPWDKPVSWQKCKPEGRDLSFLEI